MRRWRRGPVVLITGLATLYIGLLSVLVISNTDCVLPMHSRNLQRRLLASAWLHNTSRVSAGRLVQLQSIPGIKTIHPLEAARLVQKTSGNKTIHPLDPLLVKVAGIRQKYVGNSTLADPPPVNVRPSATGMKRLDANRLEKTVSLKPCPRPFNGTECTVVMQGMKGLQNTHSGYISINNRNVLQWTGKTGIFLVKFSNACIVQETVHFDENNLANFSGYVVELIRDTLVLGISGDFNFLSRPNVTTMLSVLGIQITGYKRDSMLAFLARAGFQGLAEWRIQLKNVVLSKTVTQGRLYNLDVHEPTYEEVVQAYPTVEEGGHWKPRHCKPLWNIAIIIPFRDRESHLLILLNNLIAFLQRQNLEFTIYVIEQGGTAVFNRASLMNIGYLEAKQRSNYDCYIFHDVDLIPEDLANQYACSDQPRHLAVTMSKFSYILPYSWFFGGVMSMRSKHLELINGFSNVMFGWGGEDDEYSQRIRSKGLSVFRYPRNVGRYFMIPHTSDKTNPFSNRSTRDSKRHSWYMKVDGLNSVNYTRLSAATRELHTHITVDIQGPTSGNDIDKFYKKAVSQLRKLSRRKLYRQHGLYVVKDDVQARHQLSPEGGSI